ncbi:MAG: pyruvate kinase [Planctomycetota bacterium]|jgi:pyruvate kinase
MATSKKTKQKRADIFARTRILATLGPATDNDKIVAEMILAGANAFRLNFSHGTHADHAIRVARVRKVARRLKRPIAILQDLQGPKIRTGPVKGKGSVFLEVGTDVRVSHKFALTEPGLISTVYKNLVSDVKVGESILLDDGLLELRCKSKTEDELVCQVICGGPLRGKKGINLPGVNVSSPSLTKKDKEDLIFGAKLGVDYVALSFVRKAKDITQLRAELAKHGSNAAIIAKIEKPEALKNLEDILEVSHGIMVARGDLGVELPGEQLPIIQKNIIAAARQRGRIVVTATQMLESMIENPRPTRAETSDVANAILDGTDVVMLSGETAVGKQPVGVIETMTNIIRHTEGSNLYHGVMQKMNLDVGRDVADATVHAACTAAEELDARTLLAFSSSGRTCFKLSFARPRSRIVGATFEENVFNRLALCWGIDVMWLKKAKNLDELYFFGERELMDGGRTKIGDLSIVITGSNVSSGGTNSIKVHRVGNLDMTDSADVARRFTRLYVKHGSERKIERRS